MVAPSAGAPSDAAPSAAAAVQDRILERAAAWATASARSRSARPRPRRSSPARSPSSPSSTGTPTPPGQLQRHPRPDRHGRRRDRVQPERPGGAQPGARRGARPPASRPSSVDAYVTDPDTLQPVQQPGRLRVPRRLVAVRADGRHRATCGTPAASPAIRPTPTATRASRRRLPRTRASRSSRPPKASTRAGTRRRPPSSRTTSSPAASTTTSRASGRPAWTRRSSMPSRPRASRSCRSSARTSAHSSSQLLNETDYAGLTGAAVTNTAAVGGAGVEPGAQLLNGETVETDPAQTSRTPSSWSLRSLGTTSATKARPRSSPGVDRARPALAARSRRSTA